MTNRVKSKIQEIENILTTLPDIIYIGLCEEVSPNDPEFNHLYEKNLEKVREEIDYLLETSDL